MARPVGYIVEKCWLTIPCVECGAAIRKRRSDPKRTCSKPCMVALRNRTKKRRVALLCKQCQKPFSIPRAWAERRGRGKHTGQFCSRPCAWAYWRAHPDEHPSRRAKAPADKWVDGQGYVWVFGPDGHRIREHHLAMEKMLGRKLRKGETVHHRNNERADNRPENLELWSGKHPAGARVRDLFSENRALRDRIAELEAKLAAR